MAIKDNKLNIELIKNSQWNEFFRLQYLFFKRYNKLDRNVDKSHTIRKLKRLLFDFCKIKHPPNYVWVASLNGKYVGHVWGVVYPIQLISKKLKFTIFNMIVKRENRKHGIGDRLLEYIVSFCRQSKIEKIDFQVKIKDRSVVKFCEKRGCTKDAYIYRLDVK